MRFILTLLTLSVLLIQPLQASERLDYVVKLKGAATLFSWKPLADARLTTTKTKCGRQACHLSELWMTSENYALLESLAPTRHLYRSFYQTKPARTFAFEKRQKKNKKKYLPYGFKHKLTVLNHQQKKAKTFVLSDTGEALPFDVLSYLSKTGKKPMTKATSEIAIESNALDRWGMIQTARYLPLKTGFSKNFAGTNGSSRLQFRLHVEGEERVNFTGKAQKVWKVRIQEKNLSSNKQQAPLSLWLSQDAKRLPLRVEMEEHIGLVRLELRD